MRVAHLDENVIPWGLNEALLGLDAMQRDEKQSLAFRLSGEDGESAFIVERVRGLGFFVTALLPDDEVESELLNPAGTGDYIEVVLGGLRTTMPSEVIVSFDVAKEALVEYLDSGRRSAALIWRTMTHGY